MQTPILFYPLTIVCIDDNQSVLDTLKINLSSKYNVITFNSPKEAFIDIQQNQNKQLIESYLKKITNKEESDFAELQLNIRLSQLSYLSQVSGKYNERCIIICDYKMPEINGIEFFKKISHLPIKKILLTEHQDYQEVMSAFNSKIIDLFLLKTTENLIEKLSTCLDELTKEYFIDHTNHLKTIIETNNKLPISDKEFEKLFVALLRNMDIKEYYLIDTQGSFLLIDSHKEKHYFIVHTEESLNGFITLYNEPECKIFVDQVTNRKKIPFFGINTDPSGIDLSEWSSHLFTPQTFTGNKLYYWAIVKANSV